MEVEYLDGRFAPRRNVAAFRGQREERSEDDATAISRYRSGAAANFRPPITNDLGMGRARTFVAIIAPRENGSETRLTILKNVEIAADSHREPTVALEFGFFPVPKFFRF